MDISRSSVHLCGFAECSLLLADNQQVCHQSTANPPHRSSTLRDGGSRLTTASASTIQRKTGEPGSATDTFECQAKPCRLSKPIDGGEQYSCPKDSFDREL